MPRLDPLTIHKSLPKTNCKRCGLATCLAFATKLIARENVVEDCLPLIEEAQYAEQLQTLHELMTSPVKGVQLGKKKITEIGGEEVLHRHELTFFNQTSIAIAVHDKMNETVFADKIKFIHDFTIDRIGDSLKLDHVCIRSVSNDPPTFKDYVQAAREITNLSFILASYNPEVLRAGLEVDAANQPLIYAATKENWTEIAGLAKEFQVPVVISVSNDLDGLLSLAKVFHETEIPIVLDPGTFFKNGGLGTTLRNFVKLRRSAIVDENKILGYPILANPAAIWMEGTDSTYAANHESLISSLLMSRYADILIMNTDQVWSILPVITLRQSIFTDPRIHPSVDAGLYEVGNPTPESPVLLTTNFKLTWFTVKVDIENLKIPSYALVVDTEGIGVEAAVAGGQLTTEKIVDLIKETKLEEKVKEKRIIIPGLAARLQGELEEESGWEVIVGPKDSSDLNKLEIIQNLLK
ncbi:MAG: acetyl-CoA decarbonylase/synthase complex subunit gamma [Candidatus Hermodarchaeota archaeon]